MCECLGCGRQLACLTEADVVPASSIPPLALEADILGEDTRGSPSLLMQIRTVKRIHALVIEYELPNA
jgi:hypothetical protein